jgi:hypothetical protein
VHQLFVKSKIDFYRIVLFKIITIPDASADNSNGQGPATINKNPAMTTWGVARGKLKACWASGVLCFRRVGLQAIQAIDSVPGLCFVVKFT